MKECLTIQETKDEYKLKHMSQFQSVLPMASPKHGLILCYPTPRLIHHCRASKKKIKKCLHLNEGKQYIHVFQSRKQSNLSKGIVIISDGSGNSVSGTLKELFVILQVCALTT